ncbi:MAG: DNA polymerase III subunit delta [Deltaproteobacteria bacterium]
MDYGARDADTGNSLREILLDLKKGNVAPCYLLYGEETFLISDALDKIIRLVLPDADRDLNLFYMDGDQVDMENLCQSLLTPPLIAGRKVVVIRNTRIFHSAGVSPEIIRKIRDNMNTDPVRAAKDFMHFLRMTGWSLEDLRDGGWKKISDRDWQKALPAEAGHDREAWLPAMIDLCVDRGLKEGTAVEGAECLADVLKSGLPEGNHLILISDAADKRKKIFKIVSETGKILHFPQIKVENRKRQILMDTARDVLSDAGKTMTPGAWEAIGRKSGFAVATSMEAIKKLITYTGERSIIEEGDVEEAIGKTKEGNVFDLTTALAEKDLNHALVALKDLLDQGTHGLLILSMMAREVRLLLHAAILIKSGKLGSFDPKIDYSRFQKSVYPVIRTWTEGGVKKEGGDLIRQHPYVIYNALRHSRKFSRDHLVEYLKDLVDVDIALKSTASDPGLLLERFVIKVCS